MNKLPNHTALKEWSNVIDALGRGEQTILIRKGGIADPKFGVEATQFYLYPTYFHQGESEARSSVTIGWWCEVVRTWSLRDLQLLHHLEPLVAMPPETLETRYRFRPDQALHVIGVRTWELPAPVSISFKPDYAGCLSWISIDDEIDVAGSRLVIGEPELQKKLGAVDALLTANA